VSPLSRPPNGAKFQGIKPVRSTVRADLVAGMLVEITVVTRASSPSYRQLRPRTVEPKGVGLIETRKGGRSGFLSDG